MCNKLTTSAPLPSNAPSWPRRALASC